MQNLLLSAMKYGHIQFALDSGIGVQEVVLTLIGPQRSATELEQLLHPSEMSVYEGLSGKRKLDFLRGRAVAKAAIGRLHPIANLKDIEVKSGIWGQPILKASIPLAMGVGITHSDAHAAAIAYPLECPLSIDLETIKERNSRVIDSITFPEEKSRLLSPQLTPAQLSTIIWSAKEALGKALKMGLNLEPKLLEVATLVELAEDSFEINFRNFSLVRAISWMNGAHVLSILFPTKIDHINISSESSNPPKSA